MKFRDRNYWNFAYSALGKNPGEAIRFITRHPLESVRLMFVNHLGDPSFNGIKGEFYKVFLLSGAVFLIRRPVYFILFIPVIAQKMLNDSMVKWGIQGFYSIEVVSVLTLAVFLSTLSIKKTHVKYALYVLLVISTTRITLIKMNHRVSLWYDPAKENLLSSSFYKQDIPVSSVRETISRIVPPDSPMVASQAIVPHYAQRHGISIFPYVHDARYMVILKGSNTYPMSPNSFEIEINKYLNDPGWKIIKNDEYLLILKR